MVKEILHSNSSNSVRPTTCLQNTLQWVCTCACFHLENPKGSLFPHARAFLERISHQPISVPYTSLAEHVLVPVSAERTGCLRWYQPKENTEGKRRLLGLRPPTIFGGWVIVGYG